MTAIETVNDCMYEAELAFDQSHHKPWLVYETEIVDGEEQKTPTAESVESYDDWAALRDAAIQSHWDDDCHARCVAAVSADAAKGVGFCDEWRTTYPVWLSLSNPPVDRLSMAWGMEMPGVLTMMVTGTSMRVAGALATSEDPHAIALQALVERAGWQIEDAAACIPKLTAAGREFGFRVDFGLTSEVVAIEPLEGTPEATCVAPRIAESLTLPVRVARSFPQFELRVHVRPVVEHGWSTGVDEGIGGFDSTEGLGD